MRVIPALNAGTSHSLHLRARPDEVYSVDKTGTLTCGEFRVVEITTSDGLRQEDALALAAAVEHDSEHTIGQGIVKSAEERGLSLPSVSAFQAVPGRGLQAIVNGRELLLGRPALLRQVNAQIAPTLQTAIERAAARGQSAITMAERTAPLAVFVVADAVRDESREAVQRLHTGRGGARIPCAENQWSPSVDRSTPSPDLFFMLSA